MRTMRKAARFGWFWFYVGAAVAVCSFVGVDEIAWWRGILLGLGVVIANWGGMLYAARHYEAELNEQAEEIEWLEMQHESTSSTD